MDATTESIAHFIGLFEVAVEEGRLRKSFEEIERPHRQPEKLGDPAPISPNLFAPYGLQPYNPGLSHQPATPSEHGMIGSVFRSAPASHEAQIVSGPRFDLPTTEPASLPGPSSDPSGYSKMQPPSSVVSVTHQTARLNDDDVFGATADFDAEHNNDLRLEFASMAREVASLSAFEPPIPRGDWAGFAEEAIGSIEAPTLDDVDLLETNVRRGEDTHGVFVDGAQAEEVPDWTKLVPAYVERNYSFGGDESAKDEATRSETGSANSESGTPAAGSAGSQASSQPGGARDGTAIPGTAGPGSAQAQQASTGSVATTRSEGGVDSVVAQPAANSGKPDPASTSTSGQGAGGEGGGRQTVTQESQSAAAESLGGDGGASGAGQQSAIAKDGSATKAVSPIKGLSGGEAVSKTGSGALEAGHDFSQDFHDWQSVDDDTIPREGHTVVTGANLAINETSIQMNWLDASVFVVRGDYTKIQSVSQVNVLVENDGELAGVSHGPASSVMNVASLIEEAAPTEDVQPNPSGLPQTWSLARLTTDLVAVNYVDQDTSATDFDWASIDSFGSSLFLGMGENQIINGAFLNEIGFYFDLVFVSGDMIEIDMIVQTNFLLDSDKVTGEGASGANVWAAGNLLYNQATIKKTGIDEIIPMRSPFSEMAENLSAGVNRMVDGVMNDALFAGSDVLRVLQIDGDFVTVNVLKQSNMIGDSDEVRIGGEAATKGINADVITGQNALLNLASIHKGGLDSKIMAGGQIYDDAMLYQAELIESDASPTGISMVPLVNEAVAFLADGMMASETPAAPSWPDSSPDLPGQVDSMQTMLS